MLAITQWQLWRAEQSEADWRLNGQTPNSDPSHSCMCNRHLSAPLLYACAVLCCAVLWLIARHQDHCRSQGTRDGRERRTRRRRLFTVGRLKNVDVRWVYRFSKSYVKCHTHHHHHHPRLTKNLKVLHDDDDDDDDVDQRWLLKNCTHTHTELM